MEHDPRGESVRIKLIEDISADLQDLVINPGVLAMLIRSIECAGWSFEEVASPSEKLSGSFQPPGLRDALPAFGGPGVAFTAQTRRVARMRGMLYESRAMDVSTQPAAVRQRRQSPLKGVLVTGAWPVAIGCATWAFGALHYDFPLWGRAVSAAFGLALFVAMLLVPGQGRKLGVLFGGFALVLAWWFSLQPSNIRNWQPDVARAAWAEICGDEITFHNVRNCDYRTETDYTPRWEERTVRLSRVTGIDMAVNYWGSPWMAHPILSFQFADAPPLCFSIETRKEVGESYSAIGGLYRQFELIYVVADERDVVRVRTNFRTGEDVYLYRLAVSPEQARAALLEYVASLNALRDRPRWYNAVTTNCTTSIRAQRAPGERAPWDWRILVNGKGDEMMYERGTLVSGGLGFRELKERSLINPRARAANGDAGFWRRIREGQPWE